MEILLERTSFKLLVCDMWDPYYINDHVTTWKQRWCDSTLNQTCSRKWIDGYFCKNLSMCSQTYLSSTLIVYNLSNKSIFDGNVIQSIKLSSCFKKCLLFDTRVISVNQFLINQWMSIHRFTLPWCLLWDVPVWEHAKYEDSKVDSLENSSLHAGNSCQGESSLTETLPDHRSVLTEPEGSLSSQNEWQSHVRSLSLLLTVLFQGHI